MPAELEEMTADSREMLTELEEMLADSREMLTELEEMLADSWEMPAELEEMTEKVRNLSQEAGNLGFWSEAEGYYRFISKTRDYKRRESS